MAVLLSVMLLVCSTGCDSTMLGLIPWLETQFGGEVTVRMAGWNAYTYNGERYVHTSEMDNFETFNGYIASREDEPIGYGYNPMLIKNPVFADAECNVIVFGGYFFNEFYVKESIEIPPLLEIEFSSIGTTDIKFQLKDFVSEEMDLETVQKSKTLEELGWKMFYFLGSSLRINFDIYKDTSGNVYIAGDQNRNNFGCYKVEDEGFKELLIEICSEDKF
jgi:hypothetical protein